MIEPVKSGLNEIRWPIAVVVTITIAAGSWVLSAGQFIERMRTLESRMDDFDRLIDVKTNDRYRAQDAERDLRNVQIQLNHLADQYRELKKECDRVAHRTK